MLSDNGPQFRSGALEGFLAARGGRAHLHPAGASLDEWSHREIFKTYNETASPLVWLFDSRAQVERFCSDFLVFYNRDRPHSAFGGQTPDEVFFGRPLQPRPLGRVDCFDGLRHWYRFGT